LVEGIGNNYPVEGADANMQELAILASVASDKNYVPTIFNMKEGRLEGNSNNNNEH
jgi:hypothetical protein